MVSTFDCIIPIGESCNITFLLQNCKLKKQTSLFEWFVSDNLKNITSVLLKIAENTDDTIIKKGEKHVYIGDSAIYSGHYTYDNFKEIYKRRRARLVESITNNSNLLFVRFEGSNNIYEPVDIDNFINAVRKMNPSCTVTLLLVTPNEKPVTHPFLVTAFYNKQSEDPYCKGKEINDFFVNTLQSIGYNINDTYDNCFNDMSWA